MELVLLLMAHVCAVCRPIKSARLILPKTPQRLLYFLRDTQQHPSLLLLLLYPICESDLSLLGRAIKTPHTAAYHDIVYVVGCARGAGGSVPQSRGAVSRICASSKMRKINKEALLTTPWAILTEWLCILGRCETRIKLPFWLARRATLSDHK